MLSLLLYVSPGIVFGIIIAMYFWTRPAADALIQFVAIVLGCTVSFAISAAAVTLLSVLITRLPPWFGSRLVTAYMIASVPGSFVVSVIFCRMLEGQASSLRLAAEMAGCAAAGVILAGVVAPLSGGVSNETHLSYWGVPIAAWQMGMAVVFGAVAEWRARIGTDVPRVTV